MGMSRSCRGADVACSKCMTWQQLQAVRAALRGAAAHVIEIGCTGRSTMWSDIWQLQVPACMALPPQLWHM